MSIQVQSKPAKSVNAILSGLRFSTAAKPNKNPVQRSPREVVLEFIDHQLSLAKGDAEGATYTVPRIRFQKDEAGISRKVEVRIVPRRAYWQNGAEWLAMVKYGNSVVELSPGHQSVVAGPELKDVIETFVLIRKAIEAGEVDSAISNAAIAAKHARKRKVSEAN